MQVLLIKQANPNWGARKIQKIFEQKHSSVSTPSESSIKRIFDKAGLVKKRRVKRVDTGKEMLQQLIPADQPNHVWTVDFKGWWYGTDYEKCLPLTLRDLYSRYLFDIRLMQNQTTEAVKEVFLSAFKFYGLPRVIRSDNGTPFAATNSIMGLTKLSVWWMSLGIIPDRIQPGKPQQNGAHERMHKDLKLEIQLSHKGNRSFYQRVIDEWRKEYNEIRPHEALGYQTPASIYKPSETKYNGEFDELIYPLGFERRKVANNGAIKIKSTEIAISHALKGYHVGLGQTEEPNRLNVWFNNFLLGEVDLQTYRFYAIHKA